MIGRRTPDVVYESGENGGAMIVDKYGSVTDPSLPEPLPRLTAGSAGSRGLRSTARLAGSKVR